MATSKTPEKGSIYLPPPTENACESFEKCLKVNCPLVIYHENATKCSINYPVIKAGDSVYKSLENEKYKLTVHFDSDVTLKGRSSFSSIGTSRNGISKPETYGP